MAINPAPDPPFGEEVARPFGRSPSNLGCVVIVGVLLALLIYALLGSGRAPSPTFSPTTPPIATASPVVVATPVAPTPGPAENTPRQTSAVPGAPTP